LTAQTLTPGAGRDHGTVGEDAVSDDAAADRHTDDIAAIGQHVPLRDGQLIQTTGPHRRRAGLLVSACIHIAVILGAVLVASAPAQFERGGEVAIPVELLVVGPAEQTAETAAPQQLQAPLTLAEEVREPDAVMPSTAPSPTPTVREAEPITPHLAEPLVLTLPSEPALPQATEAVPAPIISSRSVAATPAEPRRVVVAKPAREPRQRAEGVARPATAAPARLDAGRATATQQAQQRGGSGGVASSAGAAEIASYRSRVLAHLARFKQYPDWARDQGVTGRASVAFNLTRNGQVTAVSLAGTSGSGLLDQATLAMVRRAAPFPVMPDGGPGAMSFNAAIRYDLR
jgi:protein TonB